MARLLIALILLVVAGAADARQIALVVGIARYERVDALKNPVRDAAAIADRLRDQGFEVIEAFDADRFALERARQRFLADARGADLALFYFAGHGIQLFDRNVLLVRDAAPAEAVSIAELGLDLTQLMADLKAAGPVRSAVLVDACRDNPLGFEATVDLLRRLQPAVPGAAPLAGARGAARGPARGLSVVQLPSRQGSGAAETLAFFAAEPGKVSFDGDGRNSFFVEGLLEAFAKPERPLTEVLRQASAYVRTVTRGEQVPQLVSDWTGDVVLGRREAAVVRYLNLSRANGDKPLSPEEARIVGEAARTYPALSGTFIAQASYSFTDNHLGASDAEKARAKAIGSANGFALDYDIDRDGRLETIAFYFRQVAVVMEVVDEGVSLIDTPCFEQDAENVEAVEIALRDINGDRRPEVFLFYQTAPGEWGKLCILEWKGIADLAAARRSAQATGYGSDLFRVLFKHEGAWTVRVGADNSIETCAGSNCHTRSAYTFDGSYFRQTLDESDAPTGGKGRPFRDHAERLRFVPPEQPALPAQQQAAAQPPPSTPKASDAPTVGQRIARYVAQDYLASGADGSVSRLQYEPQVAYYGKQVARADVLAEKQKYVVRWPRRRFTLAPDTVRLSQGGGGLVDVVFEYEFEVADAKRTSAGRGRTRLTLRDTGQGFSIAREEGEVVQRK